MQKEVEIPIMLGAPRDIIFCCGLEEGLESIQHEARYAIVRFVSGVDPSQYLRFFVRCLPEEKDKLCFMPFETMQIISEARVQIEKLRLYVPSAMKKDGKKTAWGKVVGKIITRCKSNNVVTWLLPENEMSIILNSLPSAQISPADEEEENKTGEARYLFDHKKHPKNLLPVFGFWAQECPWDGVKKMRDEAAALALGRMPTTEEFCEQPTKYSPYQRMLILHKIKELSPDQCEALLKIEELTPAEKAEIMKKLRGATAIEIFKISEIACCAAEVLHDKLKKLSVDEATKDGERISPETLDRLLEAGLKDNKRTHTALVKKLLVCAPADLSLLIEHGLSAKAQRLVLKKGNFFFLWRTKSGPHKVRP